MVKRLRTSRGLTQQALADRADLSPETIVRLEAGTFSPSLETLHKAAAGLDTSLTVLFAAFEGTDDAAARELLTLAREFSGLEVALALRTLTLLHTMVAQVADHAEVGDDGR